MHLLKQIFSFETTK